MTRGKQANLNLFLQQAVDTCHDHAMGPEKLCRNQPEGFRILRSQNLSYTKLGLVFWKGAPQKDFRGIT